MSGEAGRRREMDCKWLLVNELLLPLVRFAKFQVGVREAGGRGIRAGIGHGWDAAATRGRRETRRGGRRETGGMNDSKGRMHGTEKRTG